MFETMVGTKASDYAHVDFKGLMTLLQTGERVGMTPSGPVANRLMHPELTEGTSSDPLRNPAYNKQRNHPAGTRGQTEEVTGAELMPITTMHVCANEQSYGIHLSLLKSLFKDLPGKQIRLECMPEFGIDVN